MRVSENSFHAGMFDREAKKQFEYFNESRTKKRRQFSVNGKRFVGKSEQIINSAREVFMKRFFIFIFLFFSLAGFSPGKM